MTNLLAILLLVCFISGCQNERVKWESTLPSGKVDELKTRNAYIVFGCVMKQGEFELPSSGHLTVSQAILRANGLASRADGKNVKLYRRVPNHHGLPSSVDVEAVLHGSRLEKDPRLLPGDIIVVPEYLINF